MARNMKILPVLTGILVLCFALYFIFQMVFVDFFIDWWWFESMNFEGYFWLKTLYRFIFSGTVTAFFFAVFLFHFWVALGYLSRGSSVDELMGVKKNSGFRYLFKRFKTNYAKVYFLISLLLGILIAIPFYLNWEQALLFFFGSKSGFVDPIFNNDISFYLFQYPIYKLIQMQLLLSTAIALVIISFLYWRQHRFVSIQDKHISREEKIHLCVLFTFMMLFLILGFILDRYELLYSDTSEPVFFGPGLIELKYKLPLIWMAIIFVSVITASLVFYVFSEKHRSKKPLVIAVAFFVVALGLQHSHTIQDLIDTIIVEPNFSRIESDEIQDNIEATLAAYALNRIKTIDFDVNIDPAKDIETWSLKRDWENIPVWDKEFLIDNYRQLQGIRPYYDFHSVDEDRYLINGHYQQVNLAAREINIEKLPQEAQNWENLHLRYTHGYGAVISPAIQDAGVPIVWYLRDLNLTSSVNIAISHPDIYYGLGKYNYAIVPNNLSIDDIAGTVENDSLEYQGHSGIAITSYFKKMLLTYYFNDLNIFFSPNISKGSKLLLHRNVKERISRVTPFLSLDKDPYLVATKDRFFWIQDAYTTSNLYPISKPTNGEYIDGKQAFNYIRNSVKIVIDAYDGNVYYYISDTKDPIINAYNQAYPGFFKPLQEMPDELLKHLRYPHDLFTVQMKIYSKYHQANPALFYEQAETRQHPVVDDRSLLPYYVTLNFDHCNDREEFVMLNPMSPINQENLSMIGVAGSLDTERCDFTYKPAITIFNFPKAIQVDGPSQVRALIDQNPEIAAQFYLWNQQNAEVKKGRMVILPINHSIVYIQPVYLLAKETKMFELARIIVSIGNQVVMDKNIRNAIDRLKVLFVDKAVN